MTAQILDGKLTSEKIRQELKAEISQLIKQNRRSPHLAMILVGENPASCIYVSHKEKACKEIGIDSLVIRLSENISQKTLHEEIIKLNKNPELDGILLQLPLPDHLSRIDALKIIDPQKDVDGLTPQNQGLLAWNLPGLYPCTPLGIIHLLDAYHISIRGKLISVIGKSVLVGASLGIMLNHRGGTVIGLHSMTQEPKRLTSQSDIVIVATGVHHLVNQHWIKKSAVVIDVGIHRNKLSQKLEGDVDFEYVKNIASYITPVPGGIGPMTIAMLLKNCVVAYKNLNR